MLAPHCMLGSLLSSPAAGPGPSRLLIPSSSPASPKTAPWCLGPAVGEQAAGQVCSLRLPSAPHITPPTPPLGGQVSQADTRNSGYQESLFMLLSQACREPHCPSPLTSLCCRDDLAAWMKSGRSGVHLQWALLASYCFL